MTTKPADILSALLKFDACTSPLNKIISALWCSLPEYRRLFESLAYKVVMAKCSRFCEYRSVKIYFINFVFLSNTYNGFRI